MATKRAHDEGVASVEEKGPPCRRCGQRQWRVRRRRKSVVRWALELALAAPDVLVFGDETRGWPAREAQLWTCLECGRTVRV